MADFGFVGPSYEAPSIYQDAQECINFRAEIDPLKQPGQRGIVALYPTPGLTSKIVFQNKEQVRGMRTLSGNDYMVAVVGSYVYLMDSTFTPKMIGQLNSNTGRVGITDNGVNIYIVDGDYRYTWRISNPDSASFVGSISGTTLTVILMKSGTITVGQSLLGLGLAAETVITALGTGTGGVGTYVINISQTITAENMDSAAVASTLTSSISGTTLTVTATSGTLYPGQTIQGAGVTAGTIITSLGSGTVLSQSIATPGTGYAVNDTVTVLGGVYGTTPATYTVASVTVGAATLGTITGGTIYTNGTYNNVQTTYVSGATATTYPTVNVVVSGAKVTSVTIVTPGTGFTATGTVLTVAAASIGGTGSGFSVPVATLTNTGSVLTLTATNAGQYTSVPSNPASTSSNGKGTDLTLTLTTGTGTGGTGNYVLSASQTVSSETMYALNFSVMPTTDGAFSGATSVDIVDNYFVYNRPGTQQWGASNPLSPISQGLSFSSKDGAPDDLVSLIVDHREVYLLGEASSEVWVDVGTFPFPYQRIPGTSTQHGIAAKASVYRLGNSFAYLSRNNRGQAQIMQMNGYTPTRISTHAVEQSLLNQYVDDAYAWTYQQEGHECYVISFPTLDLTWVYDLSTQMWHKWLSIDTNNVFHRHRGNCSSVFQGQVLVGDIDNGQIYLLDPSNYTDNGNEIRRVRRAPHIVTDLQRQYLEELQIQFQPGVGLVGYSEASNDPSNAIAAIAIAGVAIAGKNISYTIGANPQAMLRWSNDGGSTWSKEHWASIGRTGQYSNRAIWRRLGWSRDRIFEVVVTDPIKAVIVSANLKASEGDN